MLYVMDKATNRILHKVGADGKYLLDKCSLLIEAPEFEFTAPLHRYKWRPSLKTFVLDADYAPTPTSAPKPGNMNITHGILDKDLFLKETGVRL
jgi:hypothetical protein